MIKGAVQFVLKTVTKIMTFAMLNLAISTVTAELRKMARVEQ